MPDNFLVPQFIDVESKIIGPITGRQFVIMMVAALIDFIFYRIFYFNIFVVAGLINTGLFLIIAFFKINGMPFHYFFINLVQTLRRPNLRVWFKSEITSLPRKEKEKVKEEIVVQKDIRSSRLSSLSLVVNTGGAFREEEELPLNNNDITK